MKIVCTQENLKNGLQIVGRTIGTSNTLPILNSILLTTENGQLRLVGTNLELAVSTTIRCKINEEGSVSIPAKTLTDLISSLPNTNINIEDQGGEIQISTDHYSTKLKTLPSEEFPPIPVVENGPSMQCKAADLKNAIDAVVFAASTSESQPEISGIFFQPGDQSVKLVATDRYRLAEKTLTLQSSTLIKPVIIPHKTALELSRLLAGYTEDVIVVMADSQMAANVGDSYLVSRLIDGQYPDYAQIIPTSFNSTILIERQSLAAALKTSGIFSRGTGTVTVKYDSEKQNMVVNAVSHDVGESTAELPAEISGTSGSVMLNYRYVLDVLGTVLTDSITVKVVDETAPVIFVPQGDTTYMYLVMPIKG